MKTFSQWLLQKEETEQHPVICSRCGRRMGWSKKEGEKSICPKCYGVKDLALSPGAGNKVTKK